MSNLFTNTPIGQMLQRAQNIPKGQFFVDIMNNKVVQKFTVKLNTDQMKIEFINADGVPLSSVGGEYSDRTIFESAKKGRPKSGKGDVNLLDKGDFHDSFKIMNVTVTGFNIESDPVKDDGTNLLDEWGKEVEGLTFESLDKLANFLIPLYQDKLLKFLLGDTG